MLKTEIYSRKSFAIIFGFALFLCLTTLALANGGLDTSFGANLPDGYARVNVTVQRADGKILVGGNFMTVNGEFRPNLVRLNADGSRDVAFNSAGSGPNGAVFDIKSLSDEKILIAGAFSSYNGVAKGGLVRLNSDGSIDPGFNSAGTGASPNARAIALQSDGKILISGTITQYNGASQFGVVRANADGSRDTSFVAPFTISQLVEEVDILPDGKILASGSFTVSGRSNVIRLNANGSVDNGFQPPISARSIRALTPLADGKILIGVDSTNFGSPPTSSVFRLNADGSPDSSYVAAAPVYFALTEYLAVQPDGKVLSAGQFTDNGLNSLSLRRLNPDGTADTSFSAVVANSGGYHVAIQQDGKLLLAGDFRYVNGSLRIGLVRLNADGSPDNNFNPTFTGLTTVASVLKQPDGKIIAAGNFHTANGTERNQVVRLKADGTLDSTLNTGTGAMYDFDLGTTSIMDAELQADGKIVLAGIFGGMNGVIRRGIVRLMPDGSVDSSFNANLGNGAAVWVFDTALQPDGKILYSVLTTDSFTGFSYNGIGRLNSDGSDDSSFQSMTDGSVRKIAVQADGRILLGGAEINVNGTPMGALARLNANGSLDTTFNTGIGFVGAVLEIALQPDNKILTGGTFISYNGVTRTRLARINPNGSLDTAFTSGADGTVSKILPLPNGKIAVGGTFASLLGSLRARFGLLNSDGSLDSTFQSGLILANTTSIRAFVLDDAGRLIIGGTFTIPGGTPRFSIARILNASPPTRFDFDGDRKADLSIFRGSNQEWWYQRSSDSVVAAAQFGVANDKFVPADFTGDGKTDIAVWRPSTGEWFVLRSENGSFFSVPFGSTGDIPAPADYDADGKADFAVFRPSSGTWFISRSGGGTDIIGFGTNGDLPVVSDFDGDARADIAIYRPSAGEWWINRSTGGVGAVQFGTSTDKAVPADYTGDGKTDIAFFRPVTGEWFVLRSEDSSFFSVPFGATGDIPVAGDYDGDGKADFSVFRPNGSTWYVNRSTAGILIQQFGLPTDSPVPAAFLY